MQAIETLAIELKAAAYDKNYRKMQSFLKSARDEHKIKLECAINGKATALVIECNRVADAIREGTVEEAKAVQNKRKPTAPKKTTKVIDDPEPKVYESVPKQPSAELLLAEANETIARLQKELADKTNEIAEQAEALEHTQATILAHANTIRSQRKQIQELSHQQQELQQTVVNLEQLLITKDTTSVDERELTEADAWVMANRIGLHMLGKPGNYRLQTKDGMIVANKLKSIDSVLAYVENYSKHLAKA